MFIRLCYKGQNGHCLCLFCIYIIFSKLKNLGSSRPNACSEASFSSQNGYRARGVYYRKARFCCVLCRKKDSKNRIFIKKFFLFTAGSICRLELFAIGKTNSLKDVRKSQMMPGQVRKLLRQQSKDFYFVGFDALIKRWDKCINVGGGYVEK
jgi:hypothetical protein